MIVRRAGEGRKIAFRGASIVRKADAADTGGRWAFGEATQPPGFENSPHSHSEPEAFYVLDGDFVLFGSGEPLDLDRGCFVLIPPGEIHGFRAGAHGGRFLAIWPPMMDGYFEAMIAAAKVGSATHESMAEIGRLHGLTGHGTLPQPKSRQPSHRESRLNTTPTQLGYRASDGPALSMSGSTVRHLGRMA